MKARCLARPVARAPAVRDSVVRPFRCAASRSSVGSARRRAGSFDARAARRGLPVRRARRGCLAAGCGEDDGPPPTRRRGRDVAARGVQRVRRRLRRARASGCTSPAPTRWPRASAPASGPTSSRPPTRSRPSACTPRASWRSRSCSRQRARRSSCRARAGAIRGDARTSRGPGVRLAVAGAARVAGRATPRELLDRLEPACATRSWPTSPSARRTPARSSRASRPGAVDAGFVYLSDVRASAGGCARSAARAAAAVGALQGRRRARDGARGPGAGLRRGSARAARAAARWQAAGFRVP